MFVSQSNLKNRRSVSVLSQQNSKRSSMSILNIQQSILNSHHQQQSCQANHKINQKYDALWNQLLPGLKNKLVESYRVVKKHIKDQIYEFDKNQLTMVYRGMSNGLKTLETAIDYGDRIKKQLAKRQSPVHKFTQSYKMLKSQPEQQYKSHTYQKDDNCQYLQRIQSLEAQIQEQRQKHSQEIRLMIQNHEEQMMFVENENNIKLTNIQKDYQHQTQQIIQAHRKREQDFRNESQRKVNQMVKAKLENMRLQELAKFEHLIKDYQLKQDRYKCLIKRLTQILNQSRNISQNLTKNYQANLSKTKAIIQKIITTQSHETKSDSYLKILSQKLNNILYQQFPINEDFKIPQKPSPTYSNPSSMPYSTMAIEHMFMKNDDSILEGHNDNFKTSLESVMEQLVWWGFFWEENQENVGSLFNIARQRSCNEGPSPSSIISHTLYPLIIDKIKLTLSKLQLATPRHSHRDSLSHMPLNPTVITDFSTEHASKLQNHCFPVRYRNIQSINELEVSDSMICDENSEKEQVIGTENGFENHSPIVNYKGYDTPEEGEQSASFDVDMF